MVEFNLSTVLFGCVEVLLKPAVSILVPICNVQKYLWKCLESLVNQTLRNVEIILINDGSTDDSLSIIREFERRDSRVVVLDKPNSGYGDSMNRGLALATGEYVGIVESDDFADVRMFEKLWRVAKQYDADMVKSNYYAYSTSTQGAEHLDFVESLAGCQYDTVFEPLKHQEIFLCPASIWSAIYRRSFLIDEGISFLPTPGASFQDTAFCFKSLFAAERVILVRDAFIRYRIDNEGSSVKSQAKVFPICDEYDEIWRFARREPDKFNQIKYQIARQQFGGYLWNLERLAPQIRHQFYVRMVEDFRRLFLEGLLDEAHFEERNWTAITHALASPDDYYARTYGPAKVSRTVIACLASLDMNGALECLRVLLNATDPHDEIIVVHEQSAELAISLRSTDERASRVFGCGDLIVSNLLCSIDPERVRGGQVSFVCLLSPLMSEDLEGLNSALAEAGFHILKEGAMLVFSCHSNKLTSLGGTAPSIPLFLIWSALDAHLRREDLISVSGLLGWHVGPTKTCDLIASVESVASFTSTLWGSEYPYETMRTAYELVLPFWERVWNVYQTLSGNALSVIRPSFEQTASAASMVFAEGEPCDEDAPLVSVIVVCCDPERSLAQSLASILNQGFRDIEVICVNDGFGNELLDELETASRADERVRVVSQLRSGLGAACNRGIALSRGRALMFVRSGDCLASNHTLEKLWNGLSKSDYRVCGGHNSAADPALCRESNCEIDISANNVWSDGEWNCCLYDTSLFTGQQDRVFSSLRCYAGNVFYLNMVSAAGGIRLIPEGVYAYQDDCGSNDISASMCCDLLSGIEANLHSATRLGAAGLYTTLVGRIEGEYLEALVACSSNSNVLLKLASIQNSLQQGLLLSSRGDDGAHLIRPLEVLPGIVSRGMTAETDGEAAHPAVADTAVVRLARRISGLSAYKGAQSLIWRAKGVLNRS